MLKCIITGGVEDLKSEKLIFTNFKLTSCTLIHHTKECPNTFLSTIYCVQVIDIFVIRKIKHFVECEYRTYKTIDLRQSMNYPKYFNIVLHYFTINIVQILYKIYKHTIK